MYGPLGYHRLGRVYPRTRVRQEYSNKKHLFPSAIPAADEIQATATLTCTSDMTGIVANVALRQPSATLLRAEATQNPAATVVRTTSSTIAAVATVTPNWTLSLNAVAALAVTSSINASAISDAFTFSLTMTTTCSMQASGKVVSLSCGTGYLCKPTTRPRKCYKLIEIRGEKTKYYHSPSKAYLPGITRCVQKDFLGANTYLP